MVNEKMDTDEEKTDDLDQKDKCDNCGSTDSTTYWDYEDGSILCAKCHKEIGEEWYDNIKSADDEIQSKNIHKKAKSYYARDENAGLKKYIIGGAVFVFILILAFSARNIFASSNNLDYSTNQVASNNLAGSGSAVQNTDPGNVQNAQLALVDFSYKLTPNKIRVGVPVRIEVDASTLAGCMKNVVIKDFNVRKTITASDNIIEFTPTKTGTFWITCSMGMGPGSFEVVNADGTSDPNAQVASPRPTGGSCGAGGGGCGCGG